MNKMSKVLQLTLNVYVNVFVLAQTGWAPLPHVYLTTGRATLVGHSSRQGLTASVHTLGTAGLQETTRRLWEQLYKISATVPDEINPPDNPAGTGLFRTNNWLYLQGHGGTGV